MPRILNLHSNMVRFIINVFDNEDIADFEIYIPIWLDLLSARKRDKRYLIIYLHSNMVRFIMTQHRFIILFLKKIYIPIWLDLLFSPPGNFLGSMSYLHSNMVRFIIEYGFTCWLKS